MTRRLARLQKLTELRKKDLDDRAARLVAARRAVDTASSRAATETARHQQAEGERAHLAQDPSDPESWRTANEWLELRELHREAARRGLASAEVVAARAHEQVLAARSALRRLEVLEERLRRVERQTEERLENKAHDEIAAQRAGARARAR
mgnify:FL=1|jgi:flagellar export protein FliJ